jgi:hypothetical protein
MKESQRIALLAAGRACRPFLARLPEIRARLGSIKAPTLRVASRLAHALKAGQAVAHWHELKAPGTLLVSVPDEILEEQIQALVHAVPDWRGKLVLLCESSRDSSALEALRQRGAAVASVNVLAVGRDLLYVVEGTRTGVRRARMLLAADRVRVVETRPHAKHFVRVGFTLGLECLAPLIAGARRSLRLAGIPRVLADTVLTVLVKEGLRRGSRSRLKMNRGVNPRRFPDLERLRFADEQLAMFYERCLRLGESQAMARGAGARSGD